RGWQGSWPTNTVGSGGGPFEEREAVKEELLEILHAGPGEAARQEVTVGECGPAPSRWTLRTMRGSVAWLTEYTSSGVWRVLHAYGLGLHAACARLFSPDPDYHRKVRRLHPAFRGAAPHPAPPGALVFVRVAEQRRRRA